LFNKLRKVCNQGSLIDNSAFVFASGYVSTDMTGDGFVDATDFSIADNNALIFIGVERP